MNYKIKVLMILLILMGIQTTHSQTLIKNEKNLEKEFKIDLTKDYKGEEVQKLINIILEEADISIENAYKQGYKQASVEFIPEIEYWKEMYSKEKSFKKKFTSGFICASSGVIIGLIGGYFLP